MKIWQAMKIDNKCKSYFGFAIRSGNLIIGGDSVLNTKKKVYLIVIAPINRTSYKRITAKAEKEGIPIIEATEDELFEVTNKVGCKCVGICEKNLAGAIIAQNK